MIIEGVEIKYLRTFRYTTQRQVTVVPLLDQAFVWSLFGGETWDVEAYVDENTRNAISELATWSLVHLEHQGRLYFAVIKQERSRYVSPTTLRMTISLVIKATAGTHYPTYLTDLEEVENDWGV